MFERDWLRCLGAFLLVNLLANPVQAGLLFRVASDSSSQFAGPNSPPGPPIQVDTGQLGLPLGDGGGGAPFIPSVLTEVTLQDFQVDGNQLFPPNFARLITPAGVSDRVSFAMILLPALTPISPLSSIKARIHFEFREYTGGSLGGYTAPNTLPAVQFDDSSLTVDYGLPIGIIPPFLIQPPNSIQPPDYSLGHSNRLTAHSSPGLRFVGAEAVVGSLDLTITLQPIGGVTFPAGTETELFTLDLTGTTETAAVPEPSSVCLAVLGGLTLLVHRWRRRRRAA